MQTFLLELCNKTTTSSKNPITVFFTPETKSSRGKKERKEKKNG
jgi:hypothetical protein